MEDKTRMFFHVSAFDNGKSQVQTDKVNSSESQEVQREFEAAADETTGPIGSGEGSGSGATSNKSVKEKKRGRGRPRKHEGVSNVRSSGAFPPPPTVSSMPSAKRPRGRPKGTGKLQALASNGGYLETAGGSFTPHMLQGFPGEDIINKIKSLCLMGTRSVCVLAATGPVSRATVFRTGTDGTLTYEGRFEILTLNGSFVVSYDDVGAPCYKNWKMSVSLADCNGRVFGGKIAGPLIAAGPGPIQLVVGSFKQNIGSDIKRKYSAGRSTPTATNHFACSSMLPSQVVSGMASPPTPHIVIRADPGKSVPSKSDNFVAENHNFNSTFLKCVGPNNLQKADTVIAENHEFSSLKGVGPSSLQKSDPMEANNVITESNGLNSSSLKSVGPNNFQNLPLSQPKSDEMITPDTNARVLQMHIKD